MARAWQLLVGVAVLSLALAFSLVAFAVVAAIALIVGAYLWWTTRHVRRELRQRMTEAAASAEQERAASGVIIDGTAVRESPAPLDESRR